MEWTGDKPRLKNQSGGFKSGSKFVRGAICWSHRSCPPACFGGEFRAAGWKGKGRGAGAHCRQGACGWVVEARTEAGHTLKSVRADEQDPPWGSLLNYCKTMLLSSDFTCHFLSSPKDFETGLSAFLVLYLFP